MNRYRIYACASLPSSNGFSLIELMVVISIMSVLAVISVPNVAIFKIRAARAEMNMNLNSISTFLHSYHAENGVYSPVIGPGNQFFIGKYTESWAGSPHLTLFDECGIDYLGLKIDNCANLRYAYTVYRDIVSPQTRFLIEAASTYVKIGGEFGDTFYYGKPYPITNLCKKTPGYDVYFSDMWTINQNNQTRVSGGIDANDAIKSCF